MGDWLDSYLESKDAEYDEYVYKPRPVVSSSWYKEYAEKIYSTGLPASPAWPVPAPEKKVVDTPSLADVLSELETSW